ncbi:hypothetical protein [Dactylosporangium sp. CA-233914]|uniref:hypothetical protein n=1 Tax=Dactylosporangium sp. CA-233914 TaxID=3239934 RepID=UPI003D90775C
MTTTANTDTTEGGPRPDEPAEQTWAGGQVEYHRHLTTLEGWRQFTAAEVAAPALLPAAKWKALTDVDRAGYDEHRLDYHTHMAVVATSTLRQVVNAGRRLALLNRHAGSARRGLILSGAAGTGKTTAITQLGKTHEATDRLRYPGLARIPVVYVTVPPGGHAKDADGGVCPVPRPAHDLPGQHDRRDRGRLRCRRRRSRRPGLCRREPRFAAVDPQRR